MILKTRAALQDALIAALRARHPYETPAIMVIPLDHVDAPRAFHGALREADLDLVLRDGGDGCGTREQGRGRQDQHGST